MQRKLIVKNARIVDPASGRDAPGSLLVEDGRIASLSNSPAEPAPEGAEVVDAKGMLLAPGLVDMRVFVGEPGYEYRETLKSAGKAAAAGGVTTFVAMPDTDPVLDDIALVEFIARRARSEAAVNVRPSAALTRGLMGEEITEYGLLKQSGAVCLTDGKKSIQSSGVLRAAFTYAASFDMPVVHHTVDYGLRGQGVMNEGLFATTLGLKGIPREAETVPLARDLQLAALTGVRYHAAQISTATSADLVAAAKASNARVSAGASVNNLSLNELDVGSYRTFFKLSPPLRAEADRLAMVEALKNDILDTIHSAHDPQDSEGKRQPFADAKNGAIGLETLLAAALRLVHDGSVPLLTVLRAMTSRPAELLGLEAGRLVVGAPADFILVNLDYPWTYEESAIRSRSKNTPFEGARFTGKVMQTFVAGETVFTHA
ncbi:MAG: dihydroorotase [Hyphomicrobiaceae bacterium]|nr:dihydroorotase [Hyphomicrobiaceae bacterium]